MLPGKYVDPAEHYEAAAEYCARNFSDFDQKSTPMLLRGLVLVPESTMEDIEANPHEFVQRCHEYAYGLRMSRI